MAIKKDQGALPAATPMSKKGLDPDVPELVTPVIEQWYENYLDRKQRENDQREREGGRAKYWASMSGKCLRQIQYQVMGFAESNAPSQADAYRFELGNFVHSQFQSVLAAKNVEGQMEARNTFDVMGEEGSARADVIVPDPEFEGSLMPVEIKTIGGFQFKMTACRFKGPPEGPKFQALRQLAMTCLAIENAGGRVDRAKIVYFATELVGANLVDVSVQGDYGRFVAEWTLDREDWSKRADAGLAEFERVETAERAETLVERYIPEERGIVDDPATGDGLRYNTEGEITGSFKAWQCRYCPFQELCASHGQLVEIEEVGS